MSDANLNVGIDSREAVTGATTAVRSINDISAAANNLQSKLQSMEASMGKLGATSGLSQAKRAMDDLNGSSRDLHKLLGSIEDRFIRIGATAVAMWAVTKAFEAMTVPLKKSIEYLALIETATLGIASSLLVVGQYQDTVTNKVLKGQQALTISRKESKAIIDQLRVANMDTIATLDELIVAYQTALPVAMARGFDKKQVMDFTLAMVQAAGAIGLPFNQMSEEIRSLLTEGAINPRNSRIATVMGLRNEDLAEYKGNAQGLFDFLMKKLEGFTIAGQESQKTLKGIWSNLTDVAKQLGGNAFEGVFTGLKTELKGLLDSIVKFDSVAKTATWDQKWVDAAKDVNEWITKTFNTLVSGGKYLIDHANVIWGIIKAYTAYQVVMLTVSVINKTISAATAAHTAILQSNAVAQVNSTEAVKIADMELLRQVELYNVLKLEMQKLTMQQEAKIASDVKSAETSRIIAAGLYSQAEASLVVARNKMTELAAKEATAKADLNTLRTQESLLIQQASLSEAAATRTFLLLEENALKQKLVVNDIIRMDQEVAFSIRKKQAAIDNLALDKAQVESNIRMLQLNQVRYANEASAQGYIKVWRTEELGLIAKRDSMIISQIALEEKLAIAKEKAIIGTGLADAKVVNNALLVERNQLESLYHKQVAATTGQLTLVKAAQIAVTEAEANLNLVRSKGVIATNAYTAAGFKLFASKEALILATAAEAEMNLVANTGRAVSAAQLALFNVGVAAATGFTIRQTIAMAAYTAATYVASAATTALNAAFTLVGGWLGVIVIAIYVAVKAWNDLANAKEKAMKKHMEKSESANSIAAQLEKEIKEFEAAEKLKREIKEKGEANVSPKTKLEAALGSDLQLYKDLENNVSNYNQRISSMRNNMTKEELDRITLLRDEDQAANVRMANAALKRYEQTKDVIHKTTPKVTKPDEAAINEAKKAQDALNAKMYEWEQIANRSERTHDNLSSKLAVLKSNLDNDTKAINDNAKATDAAKKSAVEYIKAKYDIAKPNMIEEDTKKGQEALNKAMLDSNRYAIAEQKADLDRQLEANLISHSQYTEKIKENIRSVTESNKSELQKQIDAKNEEFYDIDNSEGARKIILAELIVLRDKYREAVSKGSIDISKADTAEIKAIEAKRKALTELQNSAKDAQLTLASMKASRVGTSSATGEVTDPVANETAMADAAYNKQMEQMINTQVELQRLIDLKSESAEMEIANIEEIAALRAAKEANYAIMDQNDLDRKQKIARAELSERVKVYDNLATMASKTFPKIQGFEKVAAMAGRKYDQEKVEKVVDGNKKMVDSGRLSSLGQKQLMGDVAGFGASVFSGLAASQDVSSRKGFETAKKYSMAATIMSTAQAIMSAMAGPWPASIGFAAAAAAMGAIQLATISATSFGGGGTVKAPAGSWAAGGSSGTGSTEGIGSKLSAPILSVDSQQTGASLDKIADKLGNAALAMDRSATALEVLTKAVTPKSNLSDAMQLAPGLNTQIAEKYKPGWENFKKNLFGGSWKIQAGGFTLGLDGDSVTSQGYTDSKKSGGFFKKNKYKTEMSETPEYLMTQLQKTQTDITSAVRSNAIALGMSGAAFDENSSKVKVSAVRIETAGRSQEAIIADLQKQFTNMGNAVVEQTLPSLKEYALGLETPVETLDRLGSAIQIANAEFAKVGKTLIESSFAGGDLAYNLLLAMGGAEEFTTKMTDYFKAMYTEEEQHALNAAEATRQVGIAFDKMGIAIPTTITAFNALRDNVTDPALFAALTEIGPTFKIITDHVKELADKAKELKSYSQSLDVRMFAAEGNTKEAELLDRRLTQEKEIADAVEKGYDVGKLKLVQEKETLKYFSDIAKEMTKARQSVLSGTLGMFGGTEEADAQIRQIERQIELAETTDFATQALKKYIWAKQDEIAAQKKATEAIKTTLLAAMTYTKSILQLRMDLLTKDVSLSPTEAYSQNKQRFDELTKETDPATVSAVINAFLESSSEMHSSGAQYQKDRENALEKLASLTGGSAGGTISQTQQQLDLLDKIAVAVGESDGMLVKQLSLTWEALQIDTGAATSSLSTAYKALGVVLNTPLTLANNNAESSAKVKIAGLQRVLNTGVKGVAAQTITNEIGILQLAIDGTISSAEAELALTTTYSIVQGALDGTIDGATAMAAINAQALTIQGALDGSINGTTASRLIQTQSLLVQSAVSGSIDGDAAATALNIQASMIQRSVNGSINGADAADIISGQGEIAYLAITGAIDGTEAATRINEQAGIVQTALGDALTGDDSISGSLADFSTSVTTAATNTRNAMLDFVKALMLVSQYTAAETKASAYYETKLRPAEEAVTAAVDYGANILSPANKSNYDAFMALDETTRRSQVSWYNLGFRDDDEYNRFIGSNDAVRANNTNISNLETAAAALRPAYIALNSEVSRIWSELNGIINAPAPSASGTSTGTRTVDGGYDVNFLGGNVNVSEVVDSVVSQVDRAIRRVGHFFGFASGTPSVPYDMLANIHQGEIIMDRQSSDVLRKYGIPQNGSADNKETVAELKEQNRLLRAILNVNQASGKRIAEATEKTANATDGIQAKTRLQAAA